MSNIAKKRVQIYHNIWTVISQSKETDRRGTQVRAFEVLVSAPAATPRGGLRTSNSCKSGEKGRGVRYLHQKLRQRGLVKFHKLVVLDND